jgi:choline kinase
MRAVILAAGRGGRLEGVIGPRPKCLARVGDRTLLERQIDALQKAGLGPITVVAGYGIEQVQRICPRTVEIVQNTRYASTNSLYSLWLARHLLLDGFVVLNCDVLFHPRMLDDLVNARYDDALLVAPRGDRGPYGDEEMKVRIRRGLVSAIAKTLPDEDCDAENVGIARFGPGGALALVDQMTSVVGSGDVRQWLPRAFDGFAQVRTLHAIDNRGLPWIEIDFPEDYWRACSDVLPAIDADALGTCAPAAAAAAGRTLRHV